MQEYDYNAKDHPNMAVTDKYQPDKKQQAMETKDQSIVLKLFREETFTSLTKVGSEEMIHQLNQ